MMAKTGYLILIASFVFSSMNCYALNTPNDHSKFNVAKIQQLTGQVGHFNSNEKTLTLLIPRDDLTIQMSGMQLTGNRGLSSSIFFKKTDDQASVRGDLVLLPDQVNPVLSVALMNGLKVTSLNNPYLWDSPRIMVMRITGEGDALQLASAIGKILTKIKATVNGGGGFPVGNLYSPTTTLNGHRIDVLLGVKGQFINDVYEVQFSSIKKADAELNKTMAANSWATFAGSENEAIVNGAIVIHESELQQALVTLRKAQFYILAIYHHPLDDDASLVSITFEGVGNIQVLAKALRSTFLVAQNGDASKMQAEGMLAESFAVNAAKAAGVIPISPSLVQNNYCSYANALRASNSSIEKKTINQPGQVIAKSVPKVMPLAKKTAPMMPELKKIMPQTLLPSAREIISTLSVVVNNQPQIGLLSHSIIKSPAVVIQGSPKIANLNKEKMRSVQGMPIVSARLILSRLSVVKSSKREDVLLLRPKNQSAVVVNRVAPTVLKTENTQIRSSKDVSTAPRRPVFSSAPAVENAKVAQRMSMLSAREVLLRLSVVKNRRFT